MRNGLFRCPRCGEENNRKDGIKLSIIYKEETAYNPLPTGTRVTSYYKTILFCKKCDKQLHTNRVRRYGLFFSIPSLIMGIVSYYVKNDIFLSVFFCIVTSLALLAFVLPFAVEIYRSIVRKTVNKKYIERAYHGNAFA